MASTSVIEITTTLKDNTESGRKSTESNLSKLEASVKRVQLTFQGFQDTLARMSWGGSSAGMSSMGQDFVSSFAMESLENFSLDGVVGDFSQFFTGILSGFDEFTEEIQGGLSWMGGSFLQGTNDSVPSQGNSAVFSRIEEKSSHDVSSTETFEMMTQENVDFSSLFTGMRTALSAVVEHVSNVNSNSIGMGSSYDFLNLSQNDGNNFGNTVETNSIFTDSTLTSSVLGDFINNYANIFGSQTANELESSTNYNSKYLGYHSEFQDFSNSFSNIMETAYDFSNISKELENISGFYENTVHETGGNISGNYDGTSYETENRNRNSTEQGISTSFMFSEGDTLGSLGILEKFWSNRFTVEGSFHGISNSGIDDSIHKTVETEENSKISLTQLEEISQLEQKTLETTGEVVNLGESMVETAMDGKTLLEESLGEFFHVILPEIFTQLWEGLGEELTNLGESATESILEPMMEFFEVALPEGMSGIWESAVESLETSKETAMETLNESTLEFFTLYIPESVQALWDSASISMVEHGLTAENTVNSGITLFFVTWIPESVQRIWDSGRNTLTSSSATASGTVNSGITSFFSSASSSVSSFFSSAQRQMNSAMASASASISSLSLSVASASSGSGASVSAYATGGILSTPHLGLVAEDGPEAIIPLSGKRRARGIELWEQAGELLGVKPYAEGGIIGMDLAEDSPEPLSVFAMGKNSGGIEKSGASISVSFGDINLNVTGVENGNEGDVMCQIRSHLGELSDEIAGQISQALEQVFANMPLAVEY